jgi:D-psicose/D-tagatose/L-ribulose 3-epimerase
MTEFGAHAFIWAGDWTPTDAERVISGAADAGLDFVEIPILRPDNMDVSGTRELLERHDIECTCSLGLPKEIHLPFAAGEAEEFLRKAVDVSAELGSDVLSGAIYTNLGTLTGKPPTEEELGEVASVLKRVARYAADQGIGLGIEPVNRYETYLINLAEQLSDILDRIDEPNVFAHLDTYHMNRGEGFLRTHNRTGPEAPVHSSLGVRPRHPGYRQRPLGRSVPGAGGDRLRWPVGHGILRCHQRRHRRRHRNLA